MWMMKKETDIDIKVSDAKQGSKEEADATHNEEMMLMVKRAGGGNSKDEVIVMMNYVMSVKKGARNEKVWDHFESLKNHCCHYIQKQMFFMFVFLFWGGWVEFSKGNGPIMA